jgi:hypothetical protein
MYVECFKRLGSLYGSAHDGEAECIREELEAMGVPMGYGRVSRAPEVLADDLPFLFRINNHK